MITTAAAHKDVVASAARDLVVSVEARDGVVAAFTRKEFFTVGHDDIGTGASRDLDYAGGAACDLVAARVSEDAHETMKHRCRVA